MKRPIAGLVAGMLVAGVALTASVPPAHAADQAQTRDQDQTQTRDQDRIYGYELMTPQERAEHRAKIRSLKTVQEREQYRLEHHKKMQERARERGVTLPDEPLPRGRGAGPGMGGGGPGPGGGAGGGGR